MVKLRNVQIYKADGVPDHLIQECRDCAQEMAKVISEKFPDKAPNILLGAFNFVFAAMITHYVVEDPKELASAARQAAIGLIKNIEHLNGIDIIKECND